MLPLDMPQHSAPWAWPGDVPTGNVYTFGLAGERFFRELKEKGRLMASRCASCDLAFMPPRHYCERCFQRLDEWVEVPSRGEVFTFTAAYYDLDGRRLEKADVFVLVRFPGVHGGLVHRLEVASPDQVHVGMPVEMVLKRRSQRRGSMSDIRHFRPAKHT